MMDAGRIAAREAGHVLDALPGGDRYELGLGRAIFTERLDPQRFLDQGLDAGFVVVRLVLVSPFGPRATAPDPGNGRRLRVIAPHQHRSFRFERPSSLRAPTARPGPLNRIPSRHGAAPARAGPPDAASGWLASRRCTRRWPRFRGGSRREGGCPPGFEIREIETVGTPIQSAMGVSGPPLLLLHGYPRNPPDP